MRWRAGQRRLEVAPGPEHCFCPAPLLAGIAAESQAARLRCTDAPCQHPARPPLSLDLCNRRGALPHSQPLTRTASQAPASSLGLDARADTAGRSPAHQEDALSRMYAPAPALRSPLLCLPRRWQRPAQTVNRLRVPMTLAACESLPVEVERPRSPILTSPAFPLMNMLSHLRSRCMMERSCKKARPERICRHQSFTTLRFTRLCLPTKLRTQHPTQHTISTQHVPPSAPACPTHPSLLATFRTARAPALPAEAARALFERARGHHLGDEYEAIILPAEVAEKVDDVRAVQVLQQLDLHLHLLLGLRELSLRVCLAAELDHIPSDLAGLLVVKALVHRLEAALT